VAQRFPDDYVHLGGDEVDFGCWQSNPSIQAWMKSKGWSNYELLEQYFEQRLIPIVQETGKKYIVWQEIFDNGLKIDPQTIVDVWKDSPWQAELGRVTAAGFGAILSAPFYLNYANDPYITNADCNLEGDWCQYYLIEPLDFPGTPEQKAKVLGGEGCMWGEYSSYENVVGNTWPKAAVVAERLWSPVSFRDVGDMRNRLAPYTCELMRRGIRASVVTGPGYCDWQ
jgi:hexosaminidase